MEVSNEKLREYTRRIMIARMRLLCNNGFYGLLLMHMRMNISDEKNTAWSDLNDKLYFNPNFLEKVSDKELDYVLMHLLLHVVLKHLNRKGDFEDKYYNEAADIVVNSNILRSNAGNLNSISLSNFGGVQEHMVPGGDEGWKYSVEEVYQMLRTVCTPNNVEDDADDADDSKDGLAEREDAAESNSGGASDAAAYEVEDGKSYKSGKTSGEDDNSDGGEGFENKDEKNNLHSKFGLGKEPEYARENSRGSESQGKEKFSSKAIGSYSGWDYHNRESEVQEADNNLQDEIWQERIMQAASAMQRRNSMKEVGQIPAFAERYLEELKKPQTDWRTVLDEFIQEEINDYSFCPPDRRFDDNPFFLPDFNEKDYRVEKVLFMIDTSGSMSDDEISQCYSEIKGAIDQFSGKLEGWLGFFDAVVVEPKPFVDEDEFMAIRSEGGGGTRFDIIFKYVAEQMVEEPPVSVVVLTDGYAPFPEEREALGIPVLWIINNEDVTPPWGKVARIDISTLE